MVELVFGATFQNLCPNLHFVLQRPLYEGRANLGNTSAGSNKSLGIREFTDLTFALGTPTSSQPHKQRRGEVEGTDNPQLSSTR